MEKQTQLGRNRTGIDMSPIDSKTMIRGARELTPVRHAEGKSVDMIREQYIREAEPLGTVPVPGTFKGALKSVMEKASGHNPEVLLNKMGERLAFERGGIRLYESMLRKCEAIESIEGSISLPMDELRQIRDEEAEHFHLLEEAITGLGADPTAQTPDADVSGTAAMGFMKVINDPRTSVSQCLEMLLSAELTDNAAWELLVSLSEEIGMDELAGRFRHAHEQEERHVQRVRAWYEQAMLSQLGKAAERKH